VRAACIHNNMYENEVVLVVCIIQYYYYVYWSTSTEYHVILVAWHKTAPRGALALNRASMLQMIVEQMLLALLLHMI
jgi:hypothetical protein